MTLSRLQSDISQLRRDLADKVSQLTFQTALSGRVTTSNVRQLVTTSVSTELASLQAAIDAVEAQVALKASTAYADTKASSDDLGALEVVVSSLQDTVSQINAGVTEVFNVRAYGAVGDGVTDDTVAIIAAIDAANPVTGGPLGTQFGSYNWYSWSRNNPVSGGAVVFFPEGTYKITSSLPLRGFVAYEGAGRGTVIAAYLPENSATETGAFVRDPDSVNGCNMPMILNLDIWTQFGHGIDLRGGGVTGLVVRDVEISAAGWAIFTEDSNTSSVDSTDSYLQNCTFEDVVSKSSGSGGMYVSGNLNRVEKLSIWRSVRTEVQLITVTGTGGTYTLTFDYGGTPRTSASLAWNASAAQVQTALGNLVNIGSTNITVEQVSWNGSNTRVLRVLFGGSNTDYATSLVARTLPLITSTSSVTGPEAGVAVAVGQKGWAKPNIQKSEVLDLRLDATGGTFTLSLEGATTSALNHNADAATIKAALDLLAKGTFTVASASAPYDWRITNTLGRRCELMTITTTSLTGGGTNSLTSIQKGFTDEAMFVVKGSGWQIDQLHIETGIAVQPVKVTGIGPSYPGFQTAAVVFDSTWIENVGDLVTGVVWEFDTVSNVEVRCSGGTSLNATGTGKLRIKNVVNLYVDQLSFGSSAVVSDSVVFDSFDTASVLHVGSIYAQWGHSFIPDEARIKVKNTLTDQYRHELVPASMGRFGNILNTNVSASATGNSTVTATYESVGTIGPCWKISWAPLVDQPPLGDRIHVLLTATPPTGVTTDSMGGNLWLSFILDWTSWVANGTSSFIWVFGSFAGTNQDGQGARWYHRGPVVTRLMNPTNIASSVSLYIYVGGATSGTVCLKNLALTAGGMFTPPPAPDKLITFADGPFHTYGTAAPSGGYWPRGSIVYNLSPSAGGVVGWMCVTAGAPGTWKSFGTLAS